MKYYRFFGDAGYCGTGYEEYYAFHDDTISREQLEDIADEERRILGEGYEYPATSGISEDDYDTLEDFEEAITLEVEWFWENVWISFEEVSKEEYLENVK
jgi:hypothetical protein